VLSLKAAGTTLAAGASESVHIVSATSGKDTSASTFTGTLPNTATVTAPNQAGGDTSDTSSATITILAPDVDILKTADNATITAGSQAGFTVTVRNDGLATATGIVLSDALPAIAGGDINWSIAAGSDTTDFQITGSPGSQVLSLKAAGTTLAAGASESVHIVSATSGLDTGTLPNTATVTAPNQAGGDTSDTSSATITVQAGTPLEKGTTATIGFWHNQNGQALINSLNGGSSATNLGNWLAMTFPNLYGPTTGPNNLTGKNNAQVAAYFLNLFSVSGQKTYAQVLAVALAVYVTDSKLAGGTYAASYGFKVAPGGVTGNETYNVGSNGTALGLTNNTSYTVLFILNAINKKAVNGVLSGAAFDAANNVADGINSAGDIG
jgi:uncharacterized repeat protein (TIGR01451 family)